MGLKGKNIIPLSVPVMTGNEWKYIKDCLDMGWVSSVGSYVENFENVIKEYVGCGHAVAVVNGTSALHASLIACGVQPGNEVITPALTFIAPVNTVKYCQAESVFMDCNSDTLCLDTGKVVEFIKRQTVKKKDGFTYNKRTGRRIKACIPVHIFGHPVDMDGLLAVCRESNIDIIEDATESLGSEYKNKKTGTFGKTGCFSFNGNKIITTGGGGMVITDDRDIAKRIRHITTQANRDTVEYSHDEIGYNYRLSNIQAAMGVAQMERLNEYIAIKRRNARIYRKLFSECDNIAFLWEKTWARTNFWFYTIRVPEKHKMFLLKKILSLGIQVRPTWKPIHTLPMYRNCETYRIEETIRAYNECINIPCSVNLDEETIRTIAESIKKCVREL